MSEHKEECKNGVEDSTIFSEEIPIYGQVALLFYIPDTIKDRETIIELIRQNGGNIVKFHECFTYQLGPKENLENHSYYKGPIYSIQWIVESVEKGTP